MTNETPLQCCNGKPAPPVVVEGWQQFLKFPKQAWGGFSVLLSPALIDPTSPVTDQLAETFCNENGLAKENLVAAVRSCDFLLKHASALNLEPSQFEKDLTALSGDQKDAAQVVASRYEKLKPQLRQSTFIESLADHGKVLVGLNWRVDQISASDRGTKLDTSVIFLTLRYRDGKELERFTVQLTRETLNDLKRFCDRFTTGQ